MARFKQGASLKGLNKVIGKLQKEVLKAQGRTAKGLVEAVTFLREDMEISEPTIPMDKGNLRASWFVTLKGGKAEGLSFAGNTTSKGKYTGSSDLVTQLTLSHTLSVAVGKKKLSKFPMGIAFGFGAFYASYVHEMVGATFTKTGSGAKYFQRAVKRNKQTMVIIIQREAMIK